MYQAHITSYESIDSTVSRSVTESIPSGLIQSQATRDNSILVHKAARD